MNTCEADGRTADGNGRTKVSAEVFQAFVREAQRLNSLSSLDSIELDYSARHLAQVLGIRGVKVLYAENIQVRHLDNVLGSYNHKDMGVRNLIKIDRTQNKVEQIATFVHEMFHRFQYADIAAFQRAIEQNNFEKETEAFEKQVMKTVGIKTGEEA